MIGECINSFSSFSQLPTAIDVIRLYCSEWNSINRDKRGVTKVLDSLKDLWNRAGIPMRDQSSIRLKLKNLISELKAILRKRTKSSRLQVKKETDFITKNRRLFDVVDSFRTDELSDAKKRFLIDQRNNRVLHFVDLNENDLELCANTDDVIDTTNSVPHAISEDEISSSEDESYIPSSSDEEDVIAKKKLKKETVQKLNDAGLSFRQMKLAAEAFIKEFDLDENDYCIGTSTFHSNSIKLRATAVNTFTEELKNHNSKVVLLFDTKSCTQINAAHLSKQKRLAIVLYNEQVNFGSLIISIFYSFLLKRNLNRFILVLE